MRIDYSALVAEQLCSIHVEVVPVQGCCCGQY